MATLEPVKLSMDKIKAIIDSGVNGLNAVHVGWPRAKLNAPEAAIHLEGKPEYASGSPYSQSQLLAKVGPDEADKYDVYFARGYKEVDLLIDFWGRNGDDIVSFIPQIRDALCQVEGDNWWETTDQSYRYLDIDPDTSGIKTQLYIGPETDFASDKEKEARGEWRQALSCQLLYPEVYIRSGMVLHTKTTIVHNNWAEEEIQQYELPIS